MKKAALAKCRENGARKTAGLADAPKGTQWLIKQSGQVPRSGIPDKMKGAEGGGPDGSGGRSAPEPWPRERTVASSNMPGGQSQRIPWSERHKSDTQAIKQCEFQNNSSREQRFMMVGFQES